MTTKENPFDIVNKVESTSSNELVIPQKNMKNSKTYTKSEYSQEQINNLLNGYIDVTRDKWSDIPVNSHVRYFKNDGTFVRGGFVTNHWLNKEGKKFIHLANSFKKRTQNYATWPVAHESISRLFKKPDINNGIEMDVVRTKTAEIIGQVNKLVDIVKAQKNRLDNQEQEIKKLYAIIRKLVPRN